MSVPVPENTRRWIVRLSGFPFVAYGKQIGTVDAATKAGAEEAAKRAHPGKTITVHPATENSEKLERAIAKLAARRPREHRHFVRPRRRQKPAED